MNFLPKNTFVGENADGSEYRIQEWGYQDLMNVDLVRIIFLFVVSILLGSIISPIIIIACLLNYNGIFRVGYILSILISSMFLYDCYSGWLGTITLSLFFDENIMNLLVMVNIIAIGLSLFFMLFGGIFHKLISNKNESVAREKFFVLIIVIILLGYLYSYNITDKNIGWVDKNIGIEPLVESTE